MKKNVSLLNLSKNKNKIIFSVVIPPPIPKQFLAKDIKQRDITSDPGKELDEAYNSRKGVI